MRGFVGGGVAILFIFQMHAFCMCAWFFCLVVTHLCARVCVCVFVCVCASVKSRTSPKSSRTHSCLSEEVVEWMKA